MRSKVCTRCKQKKTIDKFHKNKTRSDGFASSCSLCEQVRKFEYYGLTPKRYQELLNAQNDCCAICGIHQSKLNHRLHINHDHKTEIIRGLLCKGCNSTLERYIKYPEGFAKYMRTFPERMIKFYTVWLKENNDDILKNE